MPLSSSRSNLLRSELSRRCVPQRLHLRPSHARGPASNQASSKVSGVLNRLEIHKSNMASALHDQDAASRYRFAVIMRSFPRWIEQREAGIERIKRKRTRRTRTTEAVIGVQNVVALGHSHALEVGVVADQDFFTLCDGSDRYHNCGIRLLVVVRIVLPVSSRSEGTVTFVELEHTDFVGVAEQVEAVANLLIGELNVFELQLHDSRVAHDDSAGRDERRAVEGPFCGHAKTFSSRAKALEGCQRYAGNDAAFHATTRGNAFLSLTAATGRMLSSPG
ncbi:hypothetical protein KC347_g96 [Hortaea werneckii]|nr:hypothetical protein KC347_g96 [Hortaea werneckii]